jgi:hypothetical protein
VTETRIADWTCDCCGHVTHVDLADDVVTPPRPTGWTRFRLGEIDGDICTSCRSVLVAAVQRCRQAAPVTNGVRP